MSSITAFLSSPTFVDGIILLLILETIVICSLRWRTSTETWWRPVANNVAGLCLLLALRLVISGAPSLWMLLALSGALAAHLFDLKSHIPNHALSVTSAPKGIR